MMTRNLKTLGLALAATLALSAVAASAANATTVTPAQFTFGVATGVQAKVDGSQIGTKTFRIGGLPPITCVELNFHGGPVNADLTPRTGPESTLVLVTPTFNTCHITLLGATKTITITPNNCHYILDAQTTQPQNTPIVTTTVDCTGGAPIEIHVYNTSNHNDTGAATLCTYHIGSQGPLAGITGTNEAGTPDDVVAHVNMTGIAIKRTTGSAITCGPENSTMVYEGTTTLRATDESGAFVNHTISS